MDENKLGFSFSPREDYPQKNRMFWFRSLLLYISYMMNNVKMEDPEQNWQWTDMKNSERDLVVTNKN